MKFGLSGFLSLLLCTIGFSVVQAGEAPQRAIVVLKASQPVSYRAQSNDLEQNQVSFVVGEVTFAPVPTARFAPGIVVRTANGWWAMQMRYNVLERKNEHGKAVDFWNDLYGGPLGAKPEEMLLAGSGVSDNPLPDEDSPGKLYMSQGEVEVVGVFEGHVAVRTSLYGDAGGAHPYEDLLFSLLRLPDFKAVPVAGLLGAEDRKVVAESLKRENAKRAAEGLEPITDGDEDVWSRATLVMGERGESLVVQTVISCCSWAENHNMYLLVEPLKTLGGRLKDLVLYGFKGGAAEGKQGTRLSLKDGKLAVRSAEGKETLLEVTGYTPAMILGVYWLDEGETLDLTKIPAPVVDKRVKKGRVR